MATLAQPDQIQNYGARLSSALEGGDWAAADRWRNALKRVFLRAVALGQPLEIAVIMELVAAARVTFALREGIVSAQDARSAEAKLAADVETFALGQAMRPDAVVLDFSARNAKDAIISALTRSNQPLSNRTLAQRLSYADETIARALSALRDEGRVVSFRAGRESLNMIPSQSAPRFRQPLDVLVKDDPKPKTTANSPDPDNQTSQLADILTGSRIVRKKSSGQFDPNEGGSSALTEAVLAELTNEPGLGVARGGVIA